jgi:hypothetical protein
MSIWINQSGNIPFLNCTNVACSLSGETIVLTYGGSDIYISDKSFFSGFLTSGTATHQFNGVAISSDGNNIVVCSKNDNNTGSGFIYQLQRGPKKGWSFNPFQFSPRDDFKCVAMSENGSIIVATSTKSIFYSRDSGSTWNLSNTTEPRTVKDGEPRTVKDGEPRSGSGSGTVLSCSPKGNYFIAANNKNIIYSINFGMDWSIFEVTIAPQNWNSFIINDLGDFYVSENTSVTSTTGNLWSGNITQQTFSILPGSTVENWTSINSKFYLVNIVASKIFDLETNTAGIYISNHSGNTALLGTDNIQFVGPKTLYNANAMCFLKGTLIRILDTKYLYKDGEDYFLAVKNLSQLELHCLKQIEIPIENLKRGDLVCSISNNELSKIHIETPNDSTGVISFFKKERNGVKYFFNQIVNVGCKTIKSKDYSTVKVFRKDKIAQNVPSKDLYLLFLQSVLFEELDHEHRQDGQDGLDLKKYCKENSKFVKISTFESKYSEKITKQEFETVFTDTTEFYNIVLSCHDCQNFQAVIANNQSCESCDSRYADS